MGLIHSAKRTIQKAGIKTLRKLIEFRKNKFRKKELKNAIRFGTTSPRNYLTFGRNFIEKFGQKKIISKKGKTFLIGKPHRFIFESGYGISVECEIEKEKVVTDIKNASLSLKDTTPRLATIGLGFEKDVLIVEAIQEDQEQKKLRNEFWRDTKTRPVELLLKETESFAKQLGFKKIQIRRPETLHYYKYPLVSYTHDELGLKRQEIRQQEVRMGMKATYNRLAKKYGYTKGEFYYTKTL